MEEKIGPKILELLSGAKTVSFSYISPSTRTGIDQLYKEVWTNVGSETTSQFTGNKLLVIAYQVEQQEQTADKGNSWVKRTISYAPELGIVVKFSTDNRTTFSQTYPVNWIMTSYTPQLPPAPLISSHSQ